MDFERKLDQFAELIVKVGINVQPGQPLIMNGPSLTRGVPLETAPLVRKIAEHAYKAGSPFVDVLWDDPEMSKIRLGLSDVEALEAHFPSWRTEGVYKALSEGAALFTLYAVDPNVFTGIDSKKVSTAQRQMESHWAVALDLIIRNTTNWGLTSMPVEGWATKVFPELAPAAAIDKLWETIFQLSRIDNDDPVAAWKTHIANLESRANYLNAKQYDWLHYRGPGTDLKVGLPANHRWSSAKITSSKGVDYVANIPTEEIFTAPDRNRAEGIVQATLPLNYSGTLIEEFSVRFKDGRVVGAEANQGQEALDHLIATDEGAARLGEAALVPQSSPIAQSGILFYNTLFDENASCHIALGSAPRESVEGGEAMSDEEFAAVGGNQSLIHVDFMIGSNKLDIDGLDKDGNTEPVMRKGEWVFSV